jgi:hypothetical protein
MKLPHLYIGDLDIYPPIVQGGMGAKQSSLISIQMKVLNTVKLCSCVA